MVVLAFANERYTNEPLAEVQKLALVTNALVNNNLRNPEVIEALGMLPAIRGR